MGTRSLIAAPYQGKIGAICCHFDGYPKHMAMVLSQHHNTHESAAALIALGNAHSIAETLETSVFYGRDRNKSGHDAEIYEDEEAFVRSILNHIDGIDAEFIYYMKDSKWFHCRIYDNPRDMLKKLTLHPAIDDNSGHELEIPAKAFLSKKDWMQKHYPELANCC